MGDFVEHLRELTEATRSVWPEDRFTGVNSSVPDYSRPALRTSRQTTETGIIFPLRINSITKSDSTTSDGKPKRLAQNYQRYIERKSAVEEITPDVFELISAVQFKETDTGSVADGYRYPERIIDKERASFGTLGGNKHERAAFWAGVEKNETQSRRIQYRVTTIFPKELSLQERCLAAIEFCSHFEKRSLPYWAVCHKPGPNAEAGLLHIHIVLYDRPTGRDMRGVWAHDVRHTHNNKYYVSKERYPYRSNKDRWVQSSDNFIRFKKTFAEACNRQLESGSHKERFDLLNSCDAEGFKKIPKFMPNKVAFLEYNGLNTIGGYRKTGSELRRRFFKAEKPWKDKIQNLFSLNANKDKEFKELEMELVELAKKGLAHARMGTISGIISDAALTRMNRRERFLDREIKRYENSKKPSELRKITNETYIAERVVIQKHAPALRKIAKDHDECEKLQNSLNAQSMKIFDKAMAEFKLRAQPAQGFSKNASDVEEASKQEKFDWDNFLQPGLLADEMSRINQLFSAEHYAEKELSTCNAGPILKIEKSEKPTVDVKSNTTMQGVGENRPVADKGHTFYNRQESLPDAPKSNLENVEDNGGQVCTDVNEVCIKPMTSGTANNSRVSEAIDASGQKSGNEIEYGIVIKEGEFKNLFRVEGVKLEDIPDGSIGDLRISNTDSNRKLPHGMSSEKLKAEHGVFQIEDTSKTATISNHGKVEFDNLELDEFAVVAKVTPNDVFDVSGDERKSFEQTKLESAERVKTADHKIKRRSRRLREGDLER